MSNDRCLHRDTLSNLQSRAESWLLYGAVFILPLQGIFSHLSLPTTPTKLIGVAMIASILLRGILGRRNPFRRTGLEFGIASVLAIGAISITTSVQPQLSVEVFATSLQYVVLFYVVTVIAECHSRQDRLVTALLTGACIAGLGSMVVWAVPGMTAQSDTVLKYSDVRRISFGIVDPNEQALYLVFALCFAMFWPFKCTPWQRIFLRVFTTLLISVGLVLTMSRTGWLVAILVCLTKTLCSENRKLVLTGLSVSCALVVVGLYMAMPDFVSHVARRWEAAVTFSDPSVRQRLVQFVIAAEAGLSRPITGHGFGTSEIVSRELQLRPGQVTAHQTHNVPLVMFLEIGAFGVAAVMLLWSQIAVEMFLAWKSGNSQMKLKLIAYILAMVSYLCVCMVMPFVYRSGFSVLLGCAIGAARLSKCHNREQL